MRTKTPQKDGSMSIRRLRRSTAEIDEQHPASMPAIDDELDPALSGRRRFLTRAAAGGAIAFGATAIPLSTLVPSALAQTGGTTPRGSTPGSTPATSGAPDKSTAKVEGNDLDIVVFLQTIELAAVAIYKAIDETGRLSSPVGESARQFALHHKDHAAKFAEFAGNQALNTANATLVGELTDRIAPAASDGTIAERQLAQLAFDLETGIAATHAFALGQFDGWEIAGLSSIIEPVESQHALAWSLVIEPDAEQWKNAIKTWIPPFQNEDGAFLPNQYAAG
jgi:hypothetical protein